MPTPWNNPYIPGDPFSYDLKWLVSKIKSHDVQLENLDQRIIELISQLLDQHDPIYWENADALIHSEMKTPSLAYIEGFYTPGDGGANLYFVTSDYNDVLSAIFYLTLDGANRWAIPIILTPYVTPEMFGAKRDGSDDFVSLQKAADVAHDYKKELVLTSGTYGISDTLVIKGGNDNTVYGITVSGDNKGDTVIKALDTMSYVIRATSDGSSIANIFLNHFIIDGDNMATTGLYWDKAAANNRIDDIKISKCTGWGYTTGGDHYLNTIEKVRVDNCDGGFKIDTGTNTSLRLVDCFVQGASNAYQIEGIYCNMINCCADNISGIVFRIPHFTGTLIGCGTEALNADVVFSGGLNTNVTIVNPLTWNLTKAAGIQVQANAGAIMNIVGGYLGYSPTNVTSPGKLYQTALQANVNFYNVKFGKFTLANTYSDITSRASFDVIGGGVKSRYNERIAYIGMDTKQTAGLVNPEGPSTMKANALYFGLGTSRAALEDGTNLYYTDYVMKGDILLSSTPADIGAAGWVQCEDVSSTPGATWATGTFKKIPIVMAGPTTERPTYYAADAGMMYYDTTLLKPIWWSGGSWRDATGATV